MSKVRYGVNGSSSPIRNNIGNAITATNFHIVIDLLNIISFGINEIQNEALVMISPFSDLTSSISCKASVKTVSAILTFSALPWTGEATSAINSTKSYFSNLFNSNRI
ncbi:hypothetical protein Nepgr_030486 [Nepenthes gracilis]|uniref:Uncharacterized protein n=1 Tax=Nepenthes gracilis TaxID=150966 RepID=A0AAD3TGJ9_NEPGR|nr:hypothetical protein Nepgr_030486 [Nepenthes gracilis]